MAWQESILEERRRRAGEQRELELRKCGKEEEEMKQQVELRKAMARGSCEERKGHEQVEHARKKFDLTRSSRGSQHSVMLLHHCDR